MLKKYLHITLATLIILLFTSCSEDDTSTGSGGGSGGSSQSCTLDESDIEGTWRLTSGSSSFSLTTNEDVSVLDGWSAVSTPMSLSIILNDDTALSASFNYLHVNSSDTEIEFFLSENSYWEDWGSTHITIVCEIDDLAACSSFLHYSNSINGTYIDTYLDALTSVEWGVSSEGIYSLVIDSFNEDSEYVEATLDLASESTVSTGSVTITANTPLVVWGVDETPEAWNQSYITFNSDGTVNHLNTLDCSVIVPEELSDCYDEGCLPTEVDGNITGCMDIDCSDLVSEADCQGWNACAWDNTCIDFEQSNSDTTWEIDCDNLVLGATQFDVLITDETMSISSSQDFCSIATVQGYYTGDECYDYVGPASDQYGLSSYQIEALVITASLNYTNDELPTMRDHNSRFVDNPIDRPGVYKIFRSK